MSWAFLITSFAIVATPGTGAILTVANGLRGGPRLAVVTAFGCTLGIVPHLVAAITGTAALLRAGGVAFEILKIAGVLYLLYMAWTTWRDKGLLIVDEAPPRQSTTRTITVAVLANLLNPKLTLFFFAFLPQFVDPADPNSLIQMSHLSAVFMAMTLVVFAGYGLFASAMRRRLIERPHVVRRIQRTFSLGYLALGAKLATTR
ncbi:LysE family translocator [Nocardia donostiensis]|uniref:Lysine transporter LysE n=1 Tax=Nocardia donostiensis TaxID=1538463 RepID=A0A1W0B7J4_9NOCA|nr:LysE family translocator [Nocardia donostiensis]ONM46067.1 lysine transporter LysE [Nocardia donostiensis]OQS13287.1 lysine transporter LysE [Nocardia donostiensis]OQS18378.1 lysine transporter LysE [Nocardia donostiensis]